MYYYRTCTRTTWRAISQTWTIYRLGNRTLYEQIWKQYPTSSSTNSSYGVYFPKTRSLETESTNCRIRSGCSLKSDPRPDSSTRGHGRGFRPSTRADRGHLSIQGTRTLHISGTTCPRRRPQGATSLQREASKHHTDCDPGTQD